MLCEYCEGEDNLKYANPLIESVDKLLITTKDTIVRKRLLKAKAQGYLFKANYYQFKDGLSSPKVLTYMNKMLSICEDQNDEAGIIEASLGISDYYFSQGKIIQQLECFESGLAHAKKINWQKGIVRFTMEIAFLYAEQDDTLQALRYLDKAISAKKLIIDEKEDARGLVVLGNFYMQLLYYKEAIDHYLKAIKLYTLKGETQTIGDLHEKIGCAYLEKREYPEALIHLNKSTEIGEKTNDIRLIYFTLLSTGRVYQHMGNFTKSIELHKEAFALAEQSGSPEAIMSSCIYLTKDYFEKGDYKNAKLYSDRALSILDGKGSVQHTYEREKLAYKIDSASNNYKDAYLHYQRYIALKNKLNKEEFNKKATRDKFQSDLEKQKMSDKAEQEKKDAIYTEEKQKQKIIIYSVSAGLLLLFLLVLFILRGLRQKQKANLELLSKNEVIAQQKHLVEEKHKEITDSINYAERIQRSFLASKELLDKHLKDYFIFFKPKDIVSGDFYWAETLTNGNFVLATADSTGHGVPGAIMSLLNIMSLEKSIEHKTDPAEILNETRKTIITRLKKDGSPEGGKDGMDVSLIIFDFKNKQLQIAAANNPVWIIRQSELIEIKPDKMPVGKHDKDKETFNTHVIDLLPGDLIYTTTDGFADQFGGPNGKKFMSKNLKELMLKNSDLLISEQKQNLESAFDSWINSYEQVDDVTIIGIRV
ncbi:SpoIIE family protein phosphatase [Aurantibacillus circumpalustris]|uniref:SpoIIE family protein phosphatase n=1 Tax=Aurantibacillus circumpalustris TaxID=3036359 RepID=UPI00295BCBE7|nr:SpoIIE family protein phosphatase [Aurantibacillus circumpalustris]